MKESSLIYRLVRRGLVLLALLLSLSACGQETVEANQEALSDLDWPTNGGEKMPPLASALNPEQLRDVVSYVTNVLGQQD